MFRRSVDVRLPVSLVDDLLGCLSGAVPAAPLFDGCKVGLFTNDPPADADLPADFFAFFFAAISGNLRKLVRTHSKRGFCGKRRNPIGGL